MRYQRLVLEAAREAAEAVLSDDVEVVIKIDHHRGSQQVAYLGGDLCVITIDPNSKMGPKATAKWVIEQLADTPTVDRGAAQSMAYMTGPHRPVAV